LGEGWGEGKKSENDDRSQYTKEDADYIKMIMGCDEKVK
jgi:hypothetical protein